MAGFHLIPYQPIKLQNVELGGFDGSPPKDKHGLLWELNTAFNVAYRATRGQADEEGERPPLQTCGHRDWNQQPIRLTQLAEDINANNRKALQDQVFH